MSAFYAGCEVHDFSGSCVDLWCKAEIMHLMIYMFLSQLLLASFEEHLGGTKVCSRSLLSPAEAQAFLQGKASQKMAQAIRMGHQQKCHNAHLLCPLEEEEAVCCSQTNHFLQQLHFWQVVSCSKHSVDHSASCRVSWQLWTSNLTGDFSRAACIFMQRSY